MSNLRHEIENFIATRYDDERRTKRIGDVLSRLVPLEVRKCSCGGDIVLDNLPESWKEHANKCEACAAKDRTQQ